MWSPGLEAGASKGTAYVVRTLSARWGRRRRRPWRRQRRRPGHIRIRRADRRRWWGRRRERHRRGARRRSPVSITNDPRDLITLRVHALLVRVVVPLLDRSPRVCSRTEPVGGAQQETTACTGGSPEGGIARRRTDRGAEGRPEDRADRSARDPALVGGLTWARPGLDRRPLSARKIVGLEFLERLAPTGQHHHAWACRYRGAGAEQGHRNHQPQPSPDHVVQFRRRQRAGGGGCGDTGCHPPGHSAT